MQKEPPRAAKVALYAAKEPPLAAKEAPLDAKEAPLAAKDLLDRKQNRYKTI